MPLPQIEALPETRWEQHFHRQAGWGGSDCAYSVPLGKERTLWLFGDTYFGEVRDGQRVNAQLVMGNSIAIQQGKDTQSARLQFSSARAGEISPPPFSARVPHAAGSGLDTD